MYDAVSGKRVGLPHNLPHQLRNKSWSLCIGWQIFPFQAKQEAYDKYANGKANTCFSVIRRSQSAPLKLSIFEYLYGLLEFHFCESRSANIPERSRHQYPVL